MLLAASVYVNEWLTSYLPICRHSRVRGAGFRRDAAADLSIATKLYAIFALLATVTVVLALVAVVQRAPPCRADRRIRSRLRRARRMSSASTRLIYAVVMESRGIYMARGRRRARKRIRRRTAPVQRPDRRRGHRMAMGRCGRRTRPQFDAVRRPHQAVPGIPPRAGAARHRARPGRRAANGATTSQSRRARRAQQATSRRWAQLYAAALQATLRQDRARHRQSPPGC